jgi:undecaprenyl-diphosphatase
MEAILWAVGAVILILAAVTMHTHPAPWPVELDFTKTLQGPHPIPCTPAWVHSSWVDATADFINRLNDPIESVAIPVFWMVVVMLFRWFRRALLLGVAVLTSSFVWGGLTLLVDRPRPLPATGICVHRVINAFSFPSGHVIHDVVLYGFLLYLSFTPTARAWRYRWVLLPLQILAVLYLLSVGLARLRAGEHWLFDVMGGYLTGVLWLFVFIFLDRWTAKLLAERRAKHAALSRA